MTHQAELTDTDDAIDTGDAEAQSGTGVAPRPIPEQRLSPDYYLG